MLARINRRGAMTGLAAALAEEQRSASLAERSRRLAQGYAQRAGTDTAEALIRQTLFAGELAGLARKADEARSDASRQAQWQADALALAERRIERLDEQAKAARSEHRATQDRLAQPVAPSMARKLQKPD